MKAKYEIEIKLLTPSIIILITSNAIHAYMYIYRPTFIHRTTKSAFQCANMHYGRVEGPEISSGTPGVGSSTCASCSSFDKRSLNDPNVP